MSANGRFRPFRCLFQTLGVWSRPSNAANIGHGPLSLEIRKRGAGCGHLRDLFVERIDSLPRQRTHARAVVALFEREQLAEGSGTSRLPANEGSRAGLHFGIGDGWNAMAHGYA